MNMKASAGLMLLLSALSSSVSAVPSVSAPAFQPGAVIEDNPTEVLVTAAIGDSQNVFAGSVYLYRLGTPNTPMSRVGVMHDDGVNGDAVRGDGVYSYKLTINEPAGVIIGFKVSAAFKGMLRRVVSDANTVAVHESLTVMNESRDFSGYNFGSMIQLMWSDLPQATSKVRIYRSESQDGPWGLVIEIDNALTAVDDAVDSVDGTLHDWYYRLDVIDANGAVIHSYPVLRVPKDTPPPTGQAADIPPYDLPFISNEKFTDTDTMTVQQIRDLFAEFGSPLKDNNVVDFDGSVIADPATTIYNAAQQYRINPQVLLVTLQKESQIVKSTSNWRTPPADGYMGAKQCDRTFVAQMECAARYLRRDMDRLTQDTPQPTPSGWLPGVAHSTDTRYENVMVTPANAATAILFTYTPLIGAKWKEWGGSSHGGTGLFIEVWETSLFRNMAHLLKWTTCGACPDVPEVEFNGEKVIMGVKGRTAEDSQPVSRHGGAAILPANESYTVSFVEDLFTWDSYSPPSQAVASGYFDAFVITSGEVEFWNMGLSDPISAPFVFGGLQYGNGAFRKSVSTEKVRTITVPGGSNPKISVVLDTATEPANDSAYPSWGVFTIKKVVPNTRVMINDNP